MIRLPDKARRLPIVLHDQMSWKMALDTIDTRIRLHLGPENGSLQHWRMAIGKAYANFQANFPGFEHNAFASLVMTVDGRGEGSNFPNLQLPAAREPYGF